jgi:hypothetical protein
VSLAQVPTLLPCALIAIASAGCGAVPASPTPEATIECRLALAAMALRDDWQRIAQATRSGNAAAMDRVYGELGPDGEVLWHLAGDLVPQTDVTREFERYGHDSWMWSDHHGDWLIDDQRKNALGQALHVADLISMLPAAPLEGCLS